MGSILKISEAVSLALHACTVIAANNEGKLSVAVIAEKINASEAHLSKVMQRLSKSGITGSTRGPKGGSILLKQPKEISLMEIYQSIEGKFPEQACLFSIPICSAGRCPMSNFAEKINGLTREYFNTTYVSDLI